MFWNQPFVLKLGHPSLFQVFSRKQYNLHQKLMQITLQPISGAGIRTHVLSNMSLVPLSLRWPGLFLLFCPFHKPAYISTI